MFSLVNQVKRKTTFIVKPMKQFFKKGFRNRAKYIKHIEKCKVNDRVILYEAYHGENFTGNPLAVYLQFRQSEEYKNYKHIIVINKTNTFVEQFRKDSNVKIVAVHDNRYLKYLATAKYLINNTSFPYYFIKRDEQVYVNTWHGTPLKTLGLDIKKTGMTTHMNIQRNLLQTDYLVTPNKFTGEKLLESHHVKEIFSGKVADIGYPRVDLTLNSKRNDVHKLLGLQTDKKVVLFAPTWRGTVGKEHDISEQLLREVTELQEKIGDEYVVLLKSHYFAYKYFEKNNVASLCVPNWIDTNMLLAGVDLLITDYSSIFFEFLPTKKPVIFYGNDIEAYEEERGFYLSLESLPGPITTTIDELAANILNIDQITEDYSHNYNEYIKRFCYNDDGLASKRFIDIVFHDKLQETLKTTETAKEKILVYCGAFFNNGITMSAITLLDNIDYDKYEVVVVENPYNNKDKWANINNVNENVHFIYRPGAFAYTLFGAYKHFMTLNRGVYETFMERIVPKNLYYNEYRRVVGNTKFDYVINFGGYNDFWTLVLAFSKVPMKSIYLHNDMAEEFNKKVNGKYKHKRTLKVIFSLYKNYDKVVSVAKSTHETNFNNLGKFVPNASSKMTYVNNLVNSKKVNELKDNYEYINHDENHYLILDRNVSKNKIRLNGICKPEPKDINFITIGRLSPEKGHAKLIRAFSKVAAIENNVKLFIVGEGPLKQTLEKLIVKLSLQEKVILVGHITNPFALIQNCDCFVLSSEYEGQGLVLLEALILQKPIIATDVTGVRSVLEGGYGKLVDNTEEALEESMIEYVMQKKNNNFTPYKTFDYNQYNYEAMERFYDVVLNKAM